MSLDRIARRSLVFFFSCLLFMAPAASEATEFFVDAGRAVSGDGSAANPWKERGDINWTAVSTALQGDSVTIYFSSRGTWTLAQWTHIPANTNSNGSPARRLTLDGQARYNTVTSGTAVWQLETVGSNRATFDTTVGQSGGPIIIQNNNSFITIKGFKIVHAANGAIELGDSSPTVNIHDIVVENNVLDTPQNGHGVWFGFAETGCYNVTVRRNTISNTPLEGIYIGHYNYLANTITGVVVEGNTLINTGTNGEGDIDIKPAAFGAIVRNNVSYSTGPGNTLAGIVANASDMQIYGNSLYNLTAHWAASGDGGSGIQINADGADGRGWPIANTIVYNNLIYGNRQAGIKLFANRASITNVKFLNNTIVGNGTNGLQAGAGDGFTITIAALVNNVFSSNTGYEIDVNGAVTIATATNNLVYHPAGGSFLRYQGMDKSWAQWQALGFDANGVNADPRLDGSYVPMAGSPAINAGAVKSEFTVDKNGVLRATPWDIGAFENGSAPGTPAPPQGLRIVP